MSVSVQLIVVLDIVEKVRCYRSVIGTSRQMHNFCKSMLSDVGYKVLTLRQWGSQPNAHLKFWRALTLIVHCYVRRLVS